MWVYALRRSLHVDGVGREGDKRPGREDELAEGGEVSDMAAGTGYISSRAGMTFEGKMERGEIHWGGGAERFPMH